MDLSARLSVLLAVQSLLDHDTLGADLLVSAFAAAIGSGRRATVCKPFPSHVFTSEGFDAAAAAVQQLTPLNEPSQLEAVASDQQLQLLQWLLLQLQRTWVVSHCTAEQLQADLLHNYREGNYCTGMRQALQQACCVFRVAPGCAAKHNHTAAAAAGAGGRRIIGFHGTDAASVHSILHQGLLTASGTRLQTTGAVFGQGIYLSTDFSTAFSFTKVRDAWQHSMLGQYLRCVLVCDVAADATMHRQSNGGLPASDSSMPHTYIVAPKPSDVCLKYLLVFSDDNMLGHVPRRISTCSSAADGSRDSTSGGSLAGHSGGSRHKRSVATSTCWVVTCAYLGFMVLYALWKSTSHSTKW